MIAPLHGLYHHKWQKNKGYVDKYVLLLPKTMMTNSSFKSSLSKNINILLQNVKICMRIQMIHFIRFELLKRTENINRRNQYWKQSAMSTQISSQGTTGVMWHLERSANTQTLKLLMQPLMTTVKIKGSRSGQKNCSPDLNTPLRPQLPLILSGPPSKSTPLTAFHLSFCAHIPTLKWTPDWWRNRWRTPWQTLNPKAFQHKIKVTRRG